ncbi:MAG: hypothetical protein ABJE95_28515 [Byssovorax sp.]
MSSKRIALLHVDDLSAGLFDDLARFFEAEYPGQLAFGSLKRSDIPVAYWWKTRFAPVLPAAADRDHVATGYYLFHHDKVVTWHTGKAPSKKKIPSDSPGLDLAVNLASLFAAVALNVVPGKKEDLNATIEALAPQITKLLSAASQK